MAASSHVGVTNAASALTSMAVKDALIQGKTSPQSELQVETVISYEEESANNSDSDTQPKQQAGRKHQNQSMFDSTSSDDETIKPPIEPRPTISPLPRKTGKHILLESSSNSSSDTDSDIEADKVRSGNKQDSNKDNNGCANTGVGKDKSDDSDITSDDNDDHDNIYDMVNQDKSVANDKDDDKERNEQDCKNDNIDIQEEPTNTVQATQSDLNTDQATQPDPNTDQASQPDHDSTFIDIRLRGLVNGEPVPLELDMIYEGFEIGDENTQDIQDVVNADTVMKPGDLLRVAKQPKSLAKMIPTAKRQQLSTQEFLAVSPMPKVRIVKPRPARRVEADIQKFLDQASATQICVLGDACLRPGKSSALNDLSKCAPCSECLQIGHYICLKKRRSQRLCFECYTKVKTLARSKARDSLVIKRVRAKHTFLLPPDELLKIESFVRPNISKRMTTWIEEELLKRDFYTEKEMRTKIE